MSRPPTSAPPRDFDFDPAPRAVPGAAGPEEWYLRLVANPFLAGCVLFLAIVAARVASRLPLSRPVNGILVVMVVIAAVMLSWRALRYSCLDCGGSGRLTRWREHLCPAVAERRVLGRARRWRGPTPMTQLLLMLWFLALLVTLAIPGISTR